VLCGALPVSHEPLHIQRFMRETQRFMRKTNSTADSVTALLERFAIKTKTHPDYPQLHLFKYDQIASPFAEPIVRECRGIILDASDDWRVVSRAFDKFFNHGEGLAATIDWSTASVQEKLDGSLCVLYPYGGKWHVATSGTPDASGDVNGFGVTFKDLFWKTWAGRPLPRDVGRCFFFELTGPLNRVVVQHRESKLTLLGGRNLHTQLEYEPIVAADYLRWGADWARVHPLTTIEAAVASFDNLKPLEHEGYVICDANFNRIKVKHPGYVALHHAKGGLSRRAFVDIARAGETSEVLAAFPEFTGQVDEIKVRLETLIAAVEADYERLRDIPVQKDFALQAVRTRLSAALFAVRLARPRGEAGPLTVRQYIQDMSVDKLLDLLGYRADDDVSRAEQGGSVE
jgi:hypothetical protein